MSSSWSLPVDLAERLAKSAFSPCAPTQARSTGWVAPRGHEHAPLFEVVGGQCILELRSQSRNLPGSVVRERVDAISKQIEEQTGRKPGRKQIKEIKEQAEHDLLPMAFTKNSSTKVWLSPNLGLLVIDTSSQSCADEVVTLLVKDVLEGVSLSLIETQSCASACMAHWLSQGEGPSEFSIDRECELQSRDEMKSVVRYSRHNLDTQEVRDHIVAGKVPTKLAMTWRSRISFVLSESLHLRKIAFLDVVMESATRAQSGDEAFDADVAIMTAELSEMIPDLIDALGGEVSRANQGGVQV